MKVDTPIFGIFLSSIAHKLHKLLILADKHITVKGLALQVGVGEAGVCRILKQLQLKGCARWVSRMLTDAHKESRETAYIKLLEQYENGGDDFLARIVTTNKNERGDRTALT